MSDQLKRTKTDSADGSESNGYLKLLMCFACCAIRQNYGVGGSKDYVLPTKLMFIQSAPNVKKIAPVTPMKTCYAARHHKQGKLNS